MKDNMQMDYLREECGVFGILASGSEAAGIAYHALMALQHRGQEGAGIAVLKNGSLVCHKDVGLVSEVFTDSVLKGLPQANFAIGHVRYSTTGGNCRENAQPMVAEYLKGRIAVAHNGNIVNALKLKQELIKEGCRFNASNDSEVISSLIAYEALHSKEIEEAVIQGVSRLKGAFSLVILSSSGKLIAIRDPWGFRPLCIGKSERGYAIASESCAFDSTGFTFLRDIRPGEMLVIDETGDLHSAQVLQSEKKGLCIFEYVYFSRVDSEIDGLLVYEAREEMGRILAREHPAQADLVCGVPDSGLEAAMGFSRESGIPLKTGFIKNRYVGRSFIFPSQTQRDAAVRLKLNPLRANIKGKRVVLVDDSIVRGTTSARMIKILKEAGAKEVHLRISSPPFRHTCYFGTDIDSEENLIANQMSVEEIRKKIGADSLGFISAEGLKKACEKSRMPFCTGCFNKDYPIKAGRVKKEGLQNHQEKEKEQI